MTDDTRPMQARDVVNDPSMINDWRNHYVMIRDTSLMGSYRNLLEAINLCSERGWETVSMAVDNAGNMFALLRDTRIKRKNDIFGGDD